MDLSIRDIALLTAAALCIAGLLWIEFHDDMEQKKFGMKFISGVVIGFVIIDLFIDDEK